MTTIVTEENWDDIIDHDAVLDAMQAAGLEVGWEHPGTAWIMIDETHSVNTGLHGYHYGSRMFLSSGSIWDEDITDDGDPDIQEGETDPETIAQAWAAWVNERRGGAVS